MNTRNSELGSSNETPVTSTLDGNEVAGKETETVSDVSEITNQETTIPEINTEPSVSCEPEVQMASGSLPYKRRKDVCSDPSISASEPRSINDLPDEVLLNILSYFGPEDLHFVIAEVCERWNALAKDVALWKNLSYECEGSDISDIEEILTNAPALHSLIIRDCNSDIDDILDLLFDTRVDLRRLIFNCWWLGERSNLFADIVDLYPDLEGLSLEGCYSCFSDEYRHITGLKKLSELYLYDCQYLCGETVRLIADSCQHLKKLSLGGCSEILDEDVIHVIDRLGKQLTTFVLDGEGFTDVAYSYLKNCARLQELEVTSCVRMTDRGLLEGIGSLHEFVSLRLTKGRNLTAQALSTILGRPPMTSVVTLDLSQCPSLDDEGLKGISERCTDLEELDVSWCQCVTDAGISMVIKHCNQLRILNLKCNTSITGEGWLALVPSCLPDLTELNLVGCYSMCEKYVKELRNAVPELDVHKC